MCCFRTKSEHASLRQSPAAVRASVFCFANENNPTPVMRRPARPSARWRHLRVLAAVAPTLAAITFLAGYYFGGH